MRIKIIIGIVSLFISGHGIAQSTEQHIPKLELRKKEKKHFNNRDSSAVIYIDTLIMKDKSSLQFFGKKNVKLIVNYAEIGNRAFISGIGRQNNASNFDIEMHLVKLGSLYVVARGQDAMNGTKTFPNGDGGHVRFAYSGITPQTSDKKGPNYLYIDVSAGGRTTNPTSDLNQIYSRIATSAPGLRGVPQGQIYSGSPGKDGEIVLKQK
ncbi:hypothetical protein [Sphingobacterium suaedae]|uniref:Uncharacterized protein n=1 Tax=Sphingobacterium suaedae TaxID=1686402 RepID=A0ABW5KD96_9SPHI